MTDVLATRNNFKILSIKDLLLARDLYHYHLTNKKNVVGTAIGLYLIRDTEPYPEQWHARKGWRPPAAKAARAPRSGSKTAAAARPPASKTERTLTNSSVRDYSWPCVLAFVDEWVKEKDFGTGAGETHPEEMVPKTLYLPDGRMVPVCVVEAKPGESDKPSLLPTWHWPASVYGGGMPILVANQGRERVATAGCLVSDAHTIYALTSRHVVGDDVEPVYTISRGKRVQVGAGSVHKLSRLLFEDIYPEFAGKNTFVNLDVGLVRVDDANDWSSSIFGLEPLGPLADLNQLNITLRLIDANVIGAGAASGVMDGVIKALFYRYKSIGGYDYVSDFLIAPRVPGETPGSRPGDSGTVWCLNELEEPDSKQTSAGSGARGAQKTPEKSPVPRPLAIQWGGQIFLDKGEAAQLPFALATSLTTVCRTLDVEVILGHNRGPAPYWGQTGHYSIAAFAITRIADAKLGALMSANSDRIAFSFAELTPKTIKEKLKEAKDNGDVVPLADVPDIIWKNHFSKVDGGRDTGFANHRSTGPEHPGHYADIDERRPSDSRTLRAICKKDPSKISLDFWKTFYEATGNTNPLKQGILPFKVWQFFTAMAGFAKAKDVDSFVCAAGILAHYVGDACQPLHGSMYADGYADQETEVTHHHRDTGEEYTETSHVGAGVHSTYETKMVDRKAKDIVDGLQTSFAHSGKSTGATIHKGLDSAKAIIGLMDRTAKSIPPVKLVDSFVEEGGQTTVAVQDVLWDKWGTATIQTMADGAKVLAAVWQAAWKAGNGGAIAQADLGPVDPKALVKLYTDRKFVESLDIDDIGPALE